MEREIKGRQERIYPREDERGDNQEQAFSNEAECERIDHMDH